ncbi:hypothetical protein E2C01_043091 [Portunus trituberculatus]|uniref:Uncharacterized protein n=1 Tax=Portunus trituberculatus TaxID=210409 RepID=A0A5B7FWC2_PORTR|nr:hypothetical protein [Portunus trituberculatus]
MPSSMFSTPFPCPPPPRQQHDPRPWHIDRRFIKKTQSSPDTSLSAGLFFYPPTSPHRLHHINIISVTTTITITTTSSTTTIASQRREESLLPNLLASTLVNCSITTVSEESSRSYTATLPLSVL